MKIVPPCLFGSVRVFSCLALLAAASTLATAAGADGDPKPALPPAGASRDFAVEHRYLNLPIKNGAPKRKVTLLVEGKVEVVNEIELAENAPDWWAGMEVGAWRGKTVTLQVADLPGHSAALALIEPGDSLKNAGDLYREPLRPQLHFSSRRGWLNDPNGLVYYAGEYHLFYQHNPYGWDWGNMHWGHATSRDLVHWQEHGDVLIPDKFGLMFSGSAVVDWQNTSGLGADGRPPVVFLYTAWGPPAVQCLAFTTDGRHLTKLDRNPVVAPITHANRDPKVFWHAPTHRWVMVLYIEKPAGNGLTRANGWPANRYIVQFLTSPNLRDWTPTGTFEGGAGDEIFLYECPDFFELAVDGDPANAKWVLTGADGDYVVGRFDGEKFTAESKKLTANYGGAFYAPQTFSDLPDGRRIQMAWGRAPSPGMPFNHLQLLPCELRLRQTPAGPRLTRTPIPELTTLRDGSDQSQALPAFRAELVELRAEIDAATAGRVEFNIRGAKIAYDGTAGELEVNGVRVPAPAIGGKQRLAVFVDRTVVEVFASDGLVYVPVAFIPAAEDKSVTVSDPAKLRSLQVFRLKSIW